jgi:hypothetical protein
MIFMSIVLSTSSIELTLWAWKRFKTSWNVTTSAFTPPYHKCYDQSKKCERDNHIYSLAPAREPKIDFNTAEKTIDIKKLLKKINEKKLTAQMINSESGYGG